MMAAVAGLGGLPAPALAAKIYLIAAADTLDPKIGESVEVDLHSIQSPFFMQLRADLLDVHEVEGNDCQPDGILGAVNACPARGDDVIVVYYSGHGAFDDQQGSYLKFPRLGAGTILTRERLKEAMRAKGCRLAVLLTDSCNKLSAIPRPQQPAKAMPAPEAPQRPAISVLFQSLFFESEGFVDLVSSNKGELSLAYPAERADEETIRKFPDAARFMIHRGGLFTVALVGLMNHSEDKPLTWRDVSNLASERVRQEFKRLKPDGLDNEDEPENPQMTQTVVPLSIPRSIRPDAGPILDNGRSPFPQFDGPNLYLGLYAYENGGKGLLLYGSRPGSPAGRLGLERGDTVLAVNDATIRTTRGFHEAINASNGWIVLTFRDVRTGEVKQADLEVGGGGRRTGGAGGHSIFGAAGEEAPGQGVKITTLVPNSPAALLGLEAGDVIQSINDRPIRTLAEYYAAVAESDDEMRLSVINVRDGQMLNAIAMLDRRAVDQVANWTFGVHAYDNGGDGIVIWATKPNGPAARLGLERGDVILGVDDLPIRDVGSYREAIARSNGQSRITFRDVRTGQVKFSDVNLIPSVGPGVVPAERSVFGASCVEQPGRGLQIVSLVANSPAALVALDPGDVILSINDQPVLTMDEYYAAVRGSNDDMAFSVLNVRTGRPIGGIVTLDR